MKTKSLKNCKILITRPLHQAQLLCNLIRNEGGNPLLFPTIEITDPHDSSSLFHAIQQLNNFDIAIFTSANAARRTLLHWPKNIRNLSIAAIGPTTAKILTQANISVATMPNSPFTSETLLQLPALQQVKNKKIIIFTGAGGRNLLAETLRDRSAKVTTAIAYQRTQPQSDTSQHLPKWRQQGIDIIVSTSGESLQNLINMVGAESIWLKKIPLLVVSQRIQSLAHKLGFTTIILGDNAMDEAVFATLKAWYANNV